jgi:hypothetical protein
MLIKALNSLDGRFKYLMWVILKSLAKMKASFSSKGSSKHFKSTSAQ